MDLQDIDDLVALKRSWETIDRQYKATRPAPGLTITSLELPWDALSEDTKAAIRKDLGAHREVLKTKLKLIGVEFKE
jgi:hypothetical protein